MSDLRDRIDELSMLVETQEASISAVLNKWSHNAIFFIGKRDRISPAEAEIYRDCIDDLRNAITGGKSE